MSNERIEKLNELREKSQERGGAARIERQRKAGKMTAHERIEMLLDRGSFK